MTGAMSFLLAMTVALMAATATAQSMFRGNAAHTGASEEEGPRRLQRIKWAFPTGERIVASPVHADGVVYVGSDDGHVYAVDAIDGRQRWKRRTGGPVASTPAVAAGVVYALSFDGTLYAFDAKSGALRWKFATGGERRFEAKGLHGFQPRHQTFADPFDVWLSSPVVADGSVYVGSSDGNVYAIDAATGDERWSFRTGNVVHASPAYADGVVFVGSFDSYLYAIDAASGREKWRFKGGDDPAIHNQVGFQSSPAVAGGVVYTGCRDSHLYAIDAATGEEKWRLHHGGSWVNTSPAVSRGRVIYGTSDTSRYLVVDAATGKPLVEQQGRAYLFSSPTVAGSVVFIGVLNGTLEARDFASGELLWEFETEASKRNPGWALTAERRFNSPMLYGNVWNEAPVAATARQFAVGSIFSTPLVVGRVVYVASTDGTLYALE